LYSSTLFFGAVLVVYMAINIYMLIRLFLTLAGCGIFRGVSCFIFIFFALCFPLGRMLAVKSPGRVSDLFLVLGTLYLAPMIYGFILTLIADFLRLLNSIVVITHTPPPFSQSTRVEIVFAVLLLSFMITLAGAWNTYNPVVIRHELTYKSDGGSLISTPPAIRIAVISDLHLGVFLGTRYLKKIVEITAAEYPDIILFTGDTIDDAGWMSNQKRRQETAELLSSLTPRLGMWAVMGNHDYYAGIDEFRRFLDETPIKLLKDEAVIPNGELLLVGRDDRTVMRSGVKRPTIGDIIRNSLGEAGWRAGLIPMIVMDHQPFDLGDSASSGATLQVSGHTHRGQIFPINFIVALMYEKHYGLYRKGDTHYYITSGAGVWGPPVRTSGRPEVVILDLKRD
jgi:predicted MPP superfamily phosphohydrolase